MSGLGLAVVFGALLAGGVWLSAGSLVTRYARLGDALRLIEGTRSGMVIEPAEGLDRVGSWLRLRWSLSLDQDTARQLQLRGLSANRFYALKALGAIAGVSLPAIVCLALLVLTGFSAVIPVVVALLGGVIGFFVPDLLVRRGSESTASDATEALLTFIDLVTLERLANQSATQALHAAAAVSDVAVFGAIRDALQRARLEQRAPFAELKTLGADLDLLALCDIADVMKLDDAGAALSGALRARVKELRDAHLTASKIAAAGVSERMTFFMVIPSMVFGLIFLAPPLLRLIGNA